MFDYPLPAPPASVEASGGFNYPNSNGFQYEALAVQVGRSSRTTTDYNHRQAGTRQAGKGSSTLPPRASDWLADWLCCGGWHDGCCHCSGASLRVWWRLRSSRCRSRWRWRASWTRCGGSWACRRCGQPSERASEHRRDQQQTDRPMMLLPEEGWLTSCSRVCRQASWWWPIDAYGWMGLAQPCHGGGRCMMLFCCCSAVSGWNESQ